MPKNPFENNNDPVTPISKGHEYRKARAREAIESLRAQIKKNKNVEKRSTFKSEREVDWDSLEEEAGVILKRLLSSAAGDLVLTHQAEEIIGDLQYLREGYITMGIKEEVGDFEKLIDDLEQALGAYLIKGL